MSAPLVSVVVATHNYGQYIGQALDSILAQTFDNWETVIVDDGSIDDTSAIVAPYLADPRFRYQHTPHVGQPAAKNIGIRSARGKFVAFLDADDAWIRTKLEKQLPLFQTQPALGVVYCRRQCMDPCGRPRSQYQSPLHRGWVLADMYRNNFVCFSSSVVRREVFDAVGLFDEGLPLAIDYDLWLRAAERFTFDFVNEPLVLYRTGHASLSRRGEERLHLALGIMRRALDRPGVRAALGRRTIRQAFADTYCSLGLAQRDRNFVAAMASYFRAMAYHPTSIIPWRALAALSLPESGRRLVRRALGHRPSWQENVMQAESHTVSPSPPE